MDPVGPDVDVVPARQRPLAPRLVLALPGRLQPGDGRRRQARGVGAEQCAEGLGEGAGADALEIQLGDQLVEAPGPLQVGRQDRRGELLPLVGGPPIVDPGLLDLDLAEAGLDGPLGEVAVADDLASPVVALEMGVGVDPGEDLGLEASARRRRAPSLRRSVRGSWTPGIGPAIGRAVDSPTAACSSAISAGWWSRDSPRVRRPNQTAIHNFRLSLDTLLGEVLER